MKKKRASVENAISKSFIRQVNMYRHYGQFALDFMVFHVPNQQVSGPIYGKHMKEMGVLAGVFDYCLFFPGGRIAFIEMKSSKIAPVRPSQRKFAMKLDEYGIPNLITWDTTEAIEFIRNLCLQWK